MVVGIYSFCFTDVVKYTVAIAITLDCVKFILRNIPNTSAGVLYHSFISISDLHIITVTLQIR